MSANWRRWLNYAKAKLDSSVRDGEDELARREARLEAEAADKPWIRSSGDAPTFEEAKARIEYETRRTGVGKSAGEGAPAATHGGATPPAVATTPSPSSAAPPGPSASDAFDMAAHQKAADERLAVIRKELGLGEEDPSPPSEPPEPPGGPPEPPLP